MKTLNKRQFVEILAVVVICLAVFLLVPPFILYLTRFFCPIMEPIELSSTGSAIVGEVEKFGNVTFVFQHKYETYRAYTRYQNRTIIESYVVDRGSFMHISDTVYSANVTYELAIYTIEGDVSNSTFRSPAELCGCSFHGGDTVIVHQTGNNEFDFDWEIK